MSLTQPSPIATEPGPIRQVAALWRYLRDPLIGAGDLRDRWGDVVVTRWTGQAVVQISDPAISQQVLRDLRDVTIKDFATRVLSEVVGDGLLTNEGASWRRQRVLIAPSFGPKAIKSYADTFAACTARAAAAWPTGSAVDVHAPCSRLTLDLLSETVFGGDLPVDAEGVERSLGGVMTAFHRLTASWEALLPPSMQRRVIRGLHREKAELDRIVLDLIAGRRALGTQGNDLLSRLIAARDDEGRAMDDRQLADEVLTLLLAGHETTALALSYALWLLAHHPDIQDRLRAEVRALGEPPGADAATRLPLTRAVILESMRLYPPAWMIGRELTAPAEIGGRTFRAGAQLLIPIWLLHRDERSFAQADRFVPDRWLDGSADAAPKGAFIPFGDGPRICVGQHFAMLEAIVALAVLINHLAVRPAPGATLELLPSITLRPRNGVRIGVERAEPAASGPFSRDPAGSPSAER